MQSARFMAMLFTICLLLTFWISFYRYQQERLEAELTIPQHSLGRSAIYYDCLHYPGGMVNVITTSVAFEYNHPDVILRISTINKNRNHNQ